MTNKQPTVSQVLYSMVHSPIHTMINSAVQHSMISVIRFTAGSAARLSSYLAIKSAIYDVVEKETE